jgi:DNA adenine methylase
MSPTDLLAELARWGFTLARDGEAILVHPVSRLPNPLRQEILAHKAGLIALLCEITPEGNTPVTRWDQDRADAILAEVHARCDRALQELADGPEAVLASSLDEPTASLKRLNDLGLALRARATVEARRNVLGVVREVAALHHRNRDQLLWSELKSLEALFAGWRSPGDPPPENWWGEVRQRCRRRPRRRGRAGVGLAASGVPAPRRTPSPTAAATGSGSPPAEGQGRARPQDRRGGAVLQTEGNGEAMNTTTQPTRPVAKLVQPLKVHGGKNAHGGKLARWIVSLMPPHRTYVEAYAGGLAVLLWKNPEGINEIVNDVSTDLTTFWRVLQDADQFEQFVRVVDAVPFSEAEWRDAGDRLQRCPDADPVSRAVWFFIHARMSLAGRANCFASISKNRTRRGQNEQAAAWRNAVQGLESVHARLMRVAVLNRDGVEVIQKFDQPDAVVYADPPYLDSVRTSPDVYAHEMSPADHLRLLDTLKQCKGKVLLSGYESPMYAAALGNWNLYKMVRPNNASGAKVKPEMTECLWRNF